MSQKTSQSIKLTKIARKVLRGLESENHALKPEELVEKLGINLRSVRYGLKLLLDAGLIVRSPDLVDLRSFYYRLNNDIEASQDSLFAMI